MDNGLDSEYTDRGLGEVTNFPEDYGKFKAPKLHNIALTAPYMHDGRLKTLDDVLEHYNHNIKGSVNLDRRLMDTNKKPKRMEISDDDKQALIAFMNTFTDNTMITDSKFSNPFRVK